MPLESTPFSLDELRALASASLFAVVDACDTPSVPTMAATQGDDRAASLYLGTAQEDYWAIAPYLFHVGAPVLDWILADLWTEPWGIFVVAHEDFAALRRHFRRFLLVRSPEGEQWYFRYYDPRVLASFLPTCSEGQLTELFGPVRAFILAEPGGPLTRIRRSAAPGSAPASSTACEPAPKAPKGPQIRIPV